jgi:hypothetical protein
MSIEKIHEEKRDIVIVERILKDGTKMELVLVDGEPHVTFETAGIVLKYKNEGEQAWKLYDSHKEVLEPYTLLLNLGSNSVGRQTRRLLSKTAFTGLCFYSDSEIAIQRQQEILEIMHEYKTKGYIAPKFEDKFEEQLFLIDRFREAIIERREHSRMLEEQKRKNLEQDEQIADIYEQIENFIPLNQRETKKINYGVKLVYKEKGIPFWEVWRKIYEVCDVGEIEQASKKNISCIMKVINSYLDQKRLSDFEED